MKRNSYMTRAMVHSDKRFARILSKLGYESREVVADAPEPDVIDEMADLRAEYEELAGKRPFMGWDADTLRAKIAEMTEAED